MCCLRFWEVLEKKDLEQLGQFALPPERPQVLFGSNRASQRMESSGFGGTGHQAIKNILKKQPSALSIQLESGGFRIGVF